MTKNSYLNMTLPGQEKKYNLDLWYDCERKVASYMREGYALDKASSYVAKTHIRDAQEQSDFYNWVRNRINYKSASLSKSAIYNSPINFSNQSNWGSEDLSDRVEKAKEVFQTSKKEEESKDKRLTPDAVKDSDNDAIYKKLRRHILGLTRLLLESRSISDEDYAEAQRNLTQLTNIVRAPYSKKVKADYIYSTSNKIAKLGEPEAAKILRKFAQEVEAEEAPANPVAAQAQPPADDVATEEVESEAPPSPTASAPGTPGGASVQIPSSDSVKPVRFEDIIVPDSDPEHRYDDLSGDIGVADAASKLDEIAGMLADRRVIRLLAEFDIMLDRLGIASMFPELAESQSKLIDAFSYALTRVTKMMGQLANAQQVIESSEKAIENAEVSGAAPPSEPAQEG